MWVGVKEGMLFLFIGGDVKVIDVCWLVLDFFGIVMYCGEVGVG